MNLDGLSREALIGELKRLLDREVSRDEDRETLVHNLRVHQVELELQNRELRDAHGALEASRARFEELYDFAPVAYFSFDARGVVLEANLTGASMVGVERARVIGRPFTELVKMADRSVFWSQLRRCERERGQVVAEMRFTVARNEERDVQAISVPVFDAAGAVVAFRTSFTDITQLKQTEAELARATREEHRLRMQFELLDRASLAFGQLLARGGGHASVTTDVMQVIADQARAIAGAAYAAVGIGGDADPPRGPWIASGMDPAVAASIGQMARARGVLGEMTRAGRAVRLRDLCADPEGVGFPPGHPELRGFLGVAIRFGAEVVAYLFVADKLGGDDLTDDDERAVELFAERAGVALELARLAREVRASVSARDNLLAVVSHDLRGPLSGIQMGADLLKRMVVGTDLETHRTLERILAASTRMGSLIEDLLQAATIEAGTFTVTAEPHHVASIIETAVELFEVPAAARSIVIERAVPPGLPAVSCDDRRVVQVLANLIGNAIKFVQPGGHVRIRARAEGDEVRIAVTDDGPGISDEQLPHLFDRYWRGRGEHGGTGLGLFIAKGIVLAHHGRIWVESRLGAGSTFTFAIPNAPTRDHASRCVMIIEDDVDFRDVVTLVLRHAAYDVVAPASSSEALRYLDAGGGLPDLILLDLRQPVMDGWQFVHEQQSRPVLAGIPVALISGEAELARHAAELAVAGYLRKPVGAGALLALVRSLAGPPERRA